MPQPTPRPKPAAPWSRQRARPAAETTAEPALPLVLLTLAGEPPGLGQDGVLDAPRAGAVFVLRRVEPAVAGDQVRWMAEALLVGVEAGDEVGLLQADGIQDRNVANAAAGDFAEEHRAPARGRLARLVPADRLGRRREQAEALVRCRHGLALEHPPRGLGDGPIDQGEEVHELVAQPLPPVRRLVPPRRRHAWRRPV